MKGNIKDTVQDKGKSSAACDFFRHLHLLKSTDSFMRTDLTAFYTRMSDS